MTTVVQSETHRVDVESGRDRRSGRQIGDGREVGSGREGVSGRDGGRGDASAFNWEVQNKIQLGQPTCNCLSL